MHRVRAFVQLPMLVALLHPIQQGASFTSVWSLIFKVELPFHLSSLTPSPSFGLGTIFFLLFFIPSVARFFICLFSISKYYMHYLATLDFMHIFHTLVFSRCRSSSIIVFVQSVHW